jgi:hypothetical protein
MMQFHYILPPFIFWIRETSVHTAISPTIEILFFSMCFPHIELRELIDRAHCALLPSSFSAAKKKKSEGNNREIMMHQTCFSVLPFFFCFVYHQKKKNWKFFYFLTFKIITNIKRLPTFYSAWSFQQPVLLLLLLFRVFDGI